MNKQELQRLEGNHSLAEGDVLREAILYGRVTSTDANALVSAARELIVAQMLIIQAMEHDLVTAQGLYALDRERANEPDAFRLTFGSLAMLARVDG